MSSRQMIHGLTAGSCLGVSPHIRNMYTLLGAASVGLRVELVDGTRLTKLVSETLVDDFGADVTNELMVQSLDDFLQAIP